MSEQIDIKLLSEYLRDVGCCRVCVLRFLKPNIDDFLDVETALGNVNRNYSLFLHCFHSNLSFTEKCFD